MWGLWGDLLQERLKITPFSTIIILLLLYILSLSRQRLLYLPSGPPRNPSILSIPISLFFLPQRPFHSNQSIARLHITPIESTTLFSCRFLDFKPPASLVIPYIMATEWSLDYCLVCDRQTLGGPYCSQTCRLSEMDHVASETLRSPTTTKSPTHSQSETATAGTSTHSSRNLSRALSPSSSQTSLSSLRSNSSLNSILSDRFQNELRDYASSFDQVRDLKRRMTS